MSDVREHDPMRLENLAPPPGSRKQRKRVGRGEGSGVGKTSGRGQKGQNSRSGSGARVGFEGGQMPLMRRIPKLGGFTPRRRTVYEVVNLSELDRFEPSEVVDPSRMAQMGLIKKEKGGVKILGDGEISKPLTVQANAFSKKAKERIEAAGGKAEVI